MKQAIAVGFKYPSVLQGCDSSCTNAVTTARCSTSYRVIHWAVTALRGYPSPRLPTFSRKETYLRSTKERGETHWPHGILGNGTAPGPCIAKNSALLSISMDYTAQLPTWDIGLNVLKKFCRKIGKHMELELFCKTGCFLELLKLWEGVNPTERDRRAGCKGGKGGNTSIYYIIPRW